MNKNQQRDAVMSILCEYDEKLHMDVVFEEGWQLGKMEMIRNLLADDIPIDTVAKCASLSVSEIEELLKSNSNNE